MTSALHTYLHTYIQNLQQNWLPAHNTKKDNVSEDGWIGFWNSKNMQHFYVKKCRLSECRVTVDIVSLHMMWI